MPSLLTASKLEQAAACAASAALPQAPLGKSEYSDAGDARHLYLSKVGELGQEAALALVPAEHRTACAGLDLDRLPIGPGLETEVAFALDLATGRARRLGAHIDRAYDVGADEIPGTADVVSSAELARREGKVRVYDYKGLHASVPRAARNWQLRLLAAAAARVYGVDRAEVGIYRVGEDRQVEPDLAELDSLDLDLALVELRAVVAGVRAARAVVEAGRTPDVQRGDHCRGCPAFASCPANGKLITLMATQPVTLAEQLKDRLTPATARTAYEQFKRMEAVVHAVREALFGYASEHPIELGDGQVFGPHQVERTEVDGRAAHQALEARFGRAIADLGVGYEASKASIQRALRAHAEAEAAAGKKPPKVAPLLREVLAAVGEAGGLTTKVSTRTEAHRPAGPDSANDPGSPGAGSAA